MDLSVCERDESGRVIDTVSYEPIEDEDVIVLTGLCTSAISLLEHVVTSNATLDYVRQPIPEEILGRLVELREELAIDVRITVKGESMLSGRLGRYVGLKVDPFTKIGDIIVNYAWTIGNIHDILRLNLQIAGSDAAYLFGFDPALKVSDIIPDDSRELKLWITNDPLPDTLPFELFLWGKYEDIASEVGARESAGDAISHDIDDISTDLMWWYPSDYDDGEVTWSITLNPSDVIFPEEYSDEPLSDQLTEFIDWYRINYRTATDDELSARLDDSDLDVYVLDIIANRRPLPPVERVVDREMVEYFTDMDEYPHDTNESEVDTESMWWYPRAVRNDVVEWDVTDDPLSVIYPPNYNNGHIHEDLARRINDYNLTRTADFESHHWTVGSGVQNIIDTLSPLPQPDRIVRRPSRDSNVRRRLVFDTDEWWIPVGTNEYDEYVWDLSDDPEREDRFEHGQISYSHITLIRDCNNEWVTKEEVMASSLLGPKAKFRVNQGQKLPSPYKAYTTNMTRYYNSLLDKGREPREGLTWNKTTNDEGNIVFYLSDNAEACRPFEMPERAFDAINSYNDGDEFLNDMFSYITDDVKGFILRGARLPSPDDVCQYHPRRDNLLDFIRRTNADVSELVWYLNSNDEWDLAVDARLISGDKMTSSQAEVVREYNDRDKIPNRRELSSFSPDVIGLMYSNIRLPNPP